MAINGGGLNKRSSLPLGETHNDRSVATHSENICDDSHNADITCYFQDDYWDSFSSDEDSSYAIYPLDSRFQCAEESGTGELE